VQGQEGRVLPLVVPSLRHVRQVPQRRESHPQMPWVQAVLRLPGEEVFPQSLQVPGMYKQYT